MRILLWNEIKRKKTALSERLKIVSLDETMEAILGNRAETLSKPEPEQPVFLAIMTKEKEPLLSNKFTSDGTFSKENIDKLKNIIISLKDQIISNNIDRINFLDYLVLFKKFDIFIICYVFIGQSYSAHQKLLHFIEGLKSESNVLSILKKANNKNTIVIIEENPIIEKLIAGSFLVDPEKFKIPFKAYKGDEPFLFVSYAHSDKLHVYPIMDYLNKSGFNIWYDEGISVSEDWIKSIVDNIEKCSAFLVFITPHIIDSEYVRKEIRFALSRKKPFYSVFLKDTNLPTELEFEISGIQSMKKYTMPDSEFYDKITEVLSPVLSGKN